MATGSQRDAVIRATAAAKEKGWAPSEQHAKDALEARKEKGARVGAIEGSTKAKLDRTGFKFGSDAMKRADAELLAALSSYFTQGAAKR